MPLAEFKIDRDAKPPSRMAPVDAASLGRVSERDKMAMSAPKKLIERLGVAAELPFPIHTHTLRHAAGYALAGRGMSPTSLD